MKKIVIIDYEMSNLKSIKNALDFLGYNSHVSNISNEIINADGVVLPGVGSFPEAMKNLKRLNLINPIHEFINYNKPFLGICLGMQLLFESSNEFSFNKGLNLIKGNVKGFNDFNQINQIPHVGWNKLKFCNKVFNDKLFSDSYFYFVHSFFVEPKDRNDVIAETNYFDLNFCSIVKKNNILGCQFHPEKSGEAGLSFLENLFNQ